MKFVNIGCGTTFHQSWLNFDINSSTPYIKRIDLRKGIPLDDCSADVCYASHILEHLPPADGKQLLVEMRRVLKPGGVVRIVVPDLEQIVKAYLLSLAHACDEEVHSENSYDWMVLELLDQMVRTCEGGDIGCLMKSCPEDMRRIIRSRIGSDADVVCNSEASKANVFNRILTISPAWYLNKFRFLLLRLAAICIAGERGKATVEEGWFRTSGEVHRWMYDRFSLKRVLVQSGFDEIEICSFDTSRIPLFVTYNLDGKAGVVRKPDSLFMEAVRS